MRLANYTHGNKEFTSLVRLFVPAFEGIYKTQAAVDKYIRAADSLHGKENHRLGVVDRALQEIVGLMIDLDYLLGQAVGDAGKPAHPQFETLARKISAFRWPMKPAAQPEAGKAAA